MKFTTIASASLISLAAAENIKLEVIGDDNTSQGFASSIHEGAGFNFLLVGESGQSFVYEDSSIYFTAGDYQFRLGYLEGYKSNFLAIGPAVQPEQWSFNSGNVLATKTFLWACNNMSDPYNYSDRSKIIVTADDAPNDTCARVTLHKVEDDSASSAVSSSAASSSAAPSESSSGWNNGTTSTEWTTVTDYTTYCPESTTITVTTCSDHKCGDKVITVTTPSTVTVTGECVVPVTSTPTPVSTTTSSQAPVKTIVSDNGAGKMGAGIAGIAGVAAALML